jgi:RNA-directed DNA polymerase
MEEVCERENCWQAYQRVKANKGSSGIDGMKVGEFSDYLKQRWPSIREQLLRGSYQPQPVRRVEIPKPDGGVRKLGIPAVLDRLIQQAVMQVLQRRWDPTFSEHSHGFRPISRQVTDKRVPPYADYRDCVVLEGMLVRNGVWGCCLRPPVFCDSHV